MQTLQLVKALTGQLSTCGGGQERASKGPTSEVVVVCYFESDPGVVAEFHAAGAKVNLLTLDRTIKPWLFVRTVRKGFANAKAEIIHIQYMAPGFLAVVAARLSFTGGVIATVHQPWTRMHHGYFAKILLRSAALLCKRFTCVSEAAEGSWFGSSQLYRGGEDADVVKPAFRRRHATIYNAIDITRIDEIVGQVQKSPLRQRLGLEGCIVVGAVARLSHIKGIDLLLEAFASVKSRSYVGSWKRGGDVSQSGKGSGRGRIVLVVVGDGEEKVRLRRQADKLGLTGQDLGGAALEQQPNQKVGEYDVLWLGRRSWEDSIKVMSTFDICVVPSRFEGFGLTAAEAMACGKPVLAANVDGLPEVVGRDGSASLLFCSESVSDLARGLSELVASQEMSSTMGKAGRRRAEGMFGIEGFRGAILQLYGIEATRDSEVD